SDNSTGCQLLMSRVPIFDFLRNLPSDNPFQLLSLKEVEETVGSSAVEEMLELEQVKVLIRCLLLLRFEAFAYENSGNPMMEIFESFKGSIVEESKDSITPVAETELKQTWNKLKDNPLFEDHLQKSLSN